MSGGRPVLVLKKKNVVAEHIQPIAVSYTFPKTAMLLEPLYLVAAFLAFFFVWCVVAFLMLCVGPDWANEKVVVKLTRHVHETKQNKIKTAWSSSA